MAQNVLTFHEVTAVAMLIKYSAIFIHTPMNAWGTSKTSLYCNFNFKLNLHCVLPLQLICMHLDVHDFATNAHRLSWCHTYVSPLSPPTVTLSVTTAVSLLSGPLVGGPTIVVAMVVASSSSTRLTTSVVGEGCVVCVTLAPRDVVCMVDR